MYILANMWFTTLMRQFFFNIDKIVFKFISLIYDLLITIARTSPLSQADIADLSSRIYKLLAVFMIFKVILSLITYVVNPDEFSNESKGVGKLTTNIIISLAMLILTPYIFNYAYQLQTIILEDNSLGTLIFGESSKKEFLNNAGDDMAYLIMSPFFTPDTSIEALTECTQLTITDSNGNKIFNNECSGLKQDYSEDSSVPSDKGMDSLVDDSKGRFTMETLKTYVAGIQKKSMSLMFRQDMAVATDSKNQYYIMDYKYIFSTAIGIVVVLLLISFCMDVALRSIKLAFLQLLAPVPILSYVDPKSGKDGMFKKWYEMCINTYISLFVRLLAIYFAVYLISLVADGKLVDVVNGSYVTNCFVIIFIVIGALMFAKQLPEILKTFFPNFDGKFTLNPLRKLEKEALGGGILKKPNDALAKGAKALALSPFSAAALGGRKLMAGIDSAAAGKGFFNGTKNVKGKLGQAKDKFMEKNLPYTAQSLKQKKEGRDEVALMHNKWKKGDRVAERLGDPKFSSLNGLSSEAYRKAGFSGEFLQSKQALDKESEKQKMLQNLSKAAATTPGGLKEAIKNLSADEQADFAKFFKPNFLETLANNSDSYFANQVLSQDKKVAGIEKVHESMRKTYQDQAELEDAIKFRKYNEEDPTVIGGMDSSYSPLPPAGSGNPIPPAGSGSDSPEPETAPEPETPEEPNPERERARNVHLYEIEKLTAMIEEYESQLAQAEEEIERAISNYETVISSLENSLEGTTDTAKIESINKQIENFVKLKEIEEQKLTNVREEYKSRIRTLEEKINLLKNGV